MPDAVFSHPRVAGVYDALDPDRSDLDVYVDLVDQLGASSVLDVGSGTGTLACRLAALGVEVCALDPAHASVEVARAKPGAHGVAWLVATAPDVAGDPARRGRYEVATMTANVAHDLPRRRTADRVHLHAALSRPGRAARIPGARRVHRREGARPALRTRARVAVHRPSMTLARCVGAHGPRPRTSCRRWEPCASRAGRRSWSARRSPEGDDGRTRRGRCLANVAGMDAVVVQVRGGELAGAGSWVYVWVAPGDGRVVHVGATSLPPAVRTWLHLHDADPRVARVAAAHPEVASEAFDVVAIAVPAGVERALVRDVVAARLHAAGRFDTSEHHGDLAPASGDSVDVVAQALLDAVDRRGCAGERRGVDGLGGG